MDTLTPIPLVNRFAVVSFLYYSRDFSKSQSTIVETFVKMEKNVCTTDKSLKDLIKQHGYTQKAFAMAINKHVSAVTAYIAGKKSPTISVVADMCRLLDESPKTVMKSLGIDVTDIPDDHPVDQ